MKNSWLAVLASIVFLLVVLTVAIKDLQKRVTKLEAAQHQKAQP